MNEKIFKALVDCGFDNVNDDDPKSLCIFLKEQGLTIVPITEGVTLTLPTSGPARERGTVAPKTQLHVKEEK